MEKRTVAGSQSTVVGCVYISGIVCLTLTLEAHTDIDMRSAPVWQSCSCGAVNAKSLQRHVCGSDVGRYSAGCFLCFLCCADSLVSCRGAKDTKSDMNMYGRTKLFNIMSSTEFNRRLQGTGVESFSCHPGVAKTDLYAPGKMDKDKLSSKVRDARSQSLPVVHPYSNLFLQQGAQTRGCIEACAHDLN